MTIKVGANIWTTGIALENPELGPAIPVVVDADTVLPGVQSIGSDIEGYSSATASVSVQASGESWASGGADITLPGGQVLASEDDYGEASVMLVQVNVDGGGDELQPDISVGFASVSGVRLTGLGYTWGTGDGQPETSSVHALGADYDYAAGDIKTGQVRTSAFGFTPFSHAVVVLRMLEGATQLPFIDFEEDIEAQASLEVESLFILMDRLGIQSELFTNGSFLNVVLDESLLAGAILSIPIYMELVEALEVADSLEVVVFKLVSLAEQLSIQGVQDTQATLTLTLASVVTLRDVVDNVLNLTFEEVIEVLAENSQQLRANVELVEAINVIAQVDLSATFIIDSSEQFEVDDELSTTAQLQMLLEEGMEVFASLRIGDEIIQGWVVNTVTRGFSEYQQFPFNSLAKLHGKYYGVAEDGLYELTGDDDDGQQIAASLKTGLLDMGTNFLKDVKAAHIGYTSTGKLVVKVTTTDGGTKEEWWYELKQSASPSMRDGRFTIGRGLRAKYWQFEIVNQEGADFDVDDIQLMYSILSRRIR